MTSTESNAADGRPRCACCGEPLPDVPLAYGADAPAAWYGTPAGERDRRWLLGSDQAVLDDEFFFVRGVLRLPVVGHDTSFEWGVWISLSRDWFERTQAMWKVEGREAEPPAFGWLSTSLPYDPGTLNLKARVHTRAVGLRPLVELEPTDHPLAREQRDGITFDRIHEIAAQLGVS